MLQNRMGIQHQFTLSIVRNDFECIYEHRIKAINRFHFTYSGDLPQTYPNNIRSVGISVAMLNALMYQSMYFECWMVFEI